MDIEKLSDKQISRLRNGHSVRVKAGKGHMGVAMGEMNMKKCTKCFKKGAGATISLSPEEVEMNGAGIFKKFKR